MLNINCSNSDCAFMNDGKCCLDTVTEYKQKHHKNVLYSDSGSSKLTKPCPYYENKI